MWPMGALVDLFLNEVALVDTASFPKLVYNLKTSARSLPVTWATFFNTNAPGSDLIGSPTTTAYVTPSDQCSGTGALVATAAACAQACATWQLAVPPPLNPGACAAFVYVWTYPQGLNPIPVPGCCFLKSGTVSGIDNYGTNLSGEEFLSGLYR